MDEPGDLPQEHEGRAGAGGGATLLVDPPYRAGLPGLERASHVIVLSWLQSCAAKYDCAETPPCG